MKKLIKLLSGCFVFCLLGPVNNVFAASAVKVRLGTLAPKASSFTKHLEEMGEQCRKAPAGGVQLTLYPDGSMGSEADMVRRMRLGQLQAALVTTSGLSEIEPSVAVLQSMPRIYRNLQEVDYIREKMEPALEKKLNAKGFVVLFWSDSGFVRFFSKQPVVTPDDLKAAKLHVATGRPNELAIYRLVGCHPVPLEIADILPGLQTGLIDCVAMPPAIALTMQLDNAAPHMLDMNWAALVGGAIITKQCWDSIPPEAQEAVRKAALETGKRIKEDGRRESVESIDVMVKRGLKVHTLTPEVDAQWEKEVEIAYGKVRGLAVPADIYDDVTNQLATFRATQPGAKK